MAVSINKLPSHSDFLSKGFFADFETRIGRSINAETTTRMLWDVFVQEELTELRDIDDFITDNQDIDLSKSFAYKNIGMDHLAQSIFKQNLYHYFGTYLHQNSSASSLVNSSITDSQIQTTFRNFLQAGFSERPLNIQARYNNITLFWAWQILLEIMRESQTTALNKANSAVFFALGEEKAVKKMSQIEFHLQTGDDDYETVKRNMDAQQESENHRNWRSIIGKQTSQYQNDVQTSTDARTQFSQLATKLIQEMESVASAITRMG